MEKNYYPLRVGKNNDSIVSDTPTRSNTSQEDIEYYGGHLICESIAPSIAKQLVEAYNEKYGPKIEIIHIAYTALKGMVKGDSRTVNDNLITKMEDNYHLQTSKGYYYISEKALDTEVTIAFIPTITAPLPTRHPLITVFGEPSSSRYKIIQGSDLLEDINDSSELGAMQAMDKLNLLLEKEGIVVVLKKPKGAKGHLGSELEKKSDVFINVEYSAPSEPIIERIPPREMPSPEMQMKDALERGELPDSIIFTEDSDFDPRTKISEEFNRISIDDQIKFITRRKARLADARGFPMALHTAIEENLKAIKRWREGPVMNIDYEKVIEDLLPAAKTLLEFDSEALHSQPKVKEAIKSSIQNAEAALGMLQALKEKRETKTELKDWKRKYPMTPAEVNMPEEQWHAGKDFHNFNAAEFNNMNPAKHPYAADEIGLTSQREKRYLIPAADHHKLINDLEKMLNTTPSRPSYQHQASVMVYAIEQYLTYLNQREDGG